LSKALEEMNIEVTKGAHQYIANTPIDLTDEQLEEVEVLIERLEEDEDVQAVYTNIN
jgi:transcriptional/translational regulatory protein YebC/TACO1